TTAEKLPDAPVRSPPRGVSHQISAVEDSSGRDLAAPVTAYWTRDDDEAAPHRGGDQPDGVVWQRPRRGAGRGRDAARARSRCDVAARAQLRTTGCRLPQGGVR